MIPNLPPDRDLPPRRQAEIRSNLIRTVSGRAAKPMARWLVPATAAAAVIAVTGGTMALSAPDNDKNPSTGQRLTVATAAPRAFPVIPGISKQRSLDIAYGCARSYGVADEDLPPRTLTEPTRTPRSQTPAPDPDETQIGSGSDLRLYNLVTDAAGTEALLFGSQLQFNCTVGGSKAMPYNAGGGDLQELDWLPGEFSMDGGGGRTLNRPNVSAVQSVAGRVSSKVATVSATFDGVTITATPVNGTYLIRRVYPKGWKNPNPRPGEPIQPWNDSPTVRAYDANGKLLGASEEGTRSPCYVTPSDVILGFAERDPNGCKPAIPWR